MGAKGPPFVMGASARVPRWDGVITCGWLWPWPRASAGRRSTAVFGLSRGCAPLRLCPGGGGCSGDHAASTSRRAPTCFVSSARGLSPGRCPRGLPSSLPGGPHTRHVAWAGDVSCCAPRERCPLNRPSLPHTSASPRPLGGTVPQTRAFPGGLRPGPGQRGPLGVGAAPRSSPRDPLSPPGPHPEFSAGSFGAGRSPCGVSSDTRPPAPS